jgi:hypothetical protein
MNEPQCDALNRTCRASHISGMLVGFMGIVARRVVSESRHFKPQNSTFGDQFREVIRIFVVICCNGLSSLNNIAAESHLCGSNNRAGDAASSAETDYRLHMCHIMACDGSVRGALGCTGRAVYCRCTYMA